METTFTRFPDQPKEEMEHGHQKRNVKFRVAGASMDIILRFGETQARDGPVGFEDSIQVEIAVVGEVNTQGIEGPLMKG